MTPELIEAMIYSGLAGAAIPLGGLLAYGEHIRPQWLQQELRHSVIAFGGGALLAAVSFILVPKGIENLPAAGAVSALFAGALFFFWLDRAIAKHGGSHAQLIAMIADFVPEAMALGAIFAHGDTAAPLLAALIGLQNLPEGFNAYREMCSKDGQPPARILKLFGGLMLLGPLAAILGHRFLADNQTMLGIVMLFAGGGILYLVFQDIAPQAHLEKRWAPPLGAVGGFAFGLLGHMLVG